MLHRCFLCHLLRVVLSWSGLLGLRGSGRVPSRGQDGRAGPPVLVTCRGGNRGGRSSAAPARSRVGAPPLLGAGVPPLAKAQGRNSPRPARGAAHKPEAG